MWSPMSPRRICDASDIMSNSGRQRYRWHSGSNSMSCPSTMSVQSVPLDHDISFRSDISVYSTTSAQEQKSSWFCGGCSYRNSDMLHTTCALCGCRRGGICAFSVPVASCARVSRPLRPRSEDDQEVVQPAQPPIGLYSTAAASESQGGNEDHDDLSSIASKVTCRRGSVSKTNLIATTKLGAATSTCTYSSGNESGSDCSSDSSRRRAMPHDDPIEQPSYVPRRSRRGPGPEIAAPHCHQPDLTRAVQGARNPSPLPTNNTMTNLTEQLGRKKKSIKDYIPRLRRRQSRAPARATPSSPSTGGVPASSKRERPSSTGHLPTRLLDQKLDFVDKNGPDSPSSFSSHHCSDEFMIACGAQSGRDLPRGGFGAVAVPGLYDY